MQSKGSALVFLFVLLVMCLGTYAAVSTLMKGRGSSIIALETLMPTAEAETAVASSTPVPTHTPAGTPTPHSELSTPVVPTATPVPPATPTSPPRPTATPTPTTTRVVTSPTPVPPVGAYLFSAIRNEQDCRGGHAYVRGTVYDADSNGLPGIRIRLYNDFGYAPDPISSKGPAEAGQYEFFMGPDAGRFYLVIVDNVGQPLSAVESVDYLPGCTNYVDWQRVQ